MMSPTKHRHVYRRLGWILALVSVSVAALAGCGDGGNKPTVGRTAPAPMTSTSPTTPGGFSPDDALLRLDDMPVGWSEDSNGSDEQRVVCGVSLARAADATAAVTYSEGGTLPQLSLKVFAFAPAKAKAILDQLSAAVEDCEPYTLTIDGQIAQVTVSPLSFPHLGDQTVALLQAVEVQGITARGDAVAVRVGDVVTTMVLADVGKPDIGEAQRFARLMVERLRAALETSQAG